MNQIKAILFDMDGVLIDAKEWHFEALNQALGLFSMEINRYEHLFAYDGLPTRKKLEMLSLERGLPQGLHEFINRLKQQFTMEQIQQKCKPLFIHEFALSRLKSDGYRCAICSNSRRQTVDVMLEKAMIRTYFDLILSNEDIEAPKPDPEMYLFCMKKLQVKPEESLILEDSDHGIRAAQASGAHLMKIDVVQDVTYFNIKNRIREIESGIESHFIV